MATSGIRLLCIGDIHLGRRPSRLPSDLHESVPPNQVGPAEAWRRSVRLAIEEEMDGVLLAGDVVEDENDFYEAYADLRAGVEELAAAGIPVVGVAGNHDVEVLPRLAEAVPGFRMLGRSGRWESEEIQGAGGGAARIVGWSFPERTVRASPLATGVGHAEGDSAGTPVVGLLHCDCDQPGSPYAPVTSRELEGGPTDVWLLGHIHRPHRLPRAPRATYLGSLTGFDPGETGPRGPWILEITPGGEPELRHVPLAPLRWEEVPVRVDGVESAADVHTLIVQALDRLHHEIGEGYGAPHAVGCRLRVVGRTALRGEIEKSLLAEDPQDRSYPFGGVWYFVHDIVMEALPEIDLEELAAGAGDPVSLLARKILVLRGDDGAEGDTSEREALIREAKKRFAAVAGDPRYSRLGDGGVPTDREVADLLTEAGLHALDELLAQRETAE